VDLAKPKHAEEDIASFAINPSILKTHLRLVYISVLGGQAGRPDQATASVCLVRPSGPVFLLRPLTRTRDPPGLTPEMLPKPSSKILYSTSEPKLAEFSIKTCSFIESHLIDKSFNIKWIICKKIYPPFPSIEPDTS